jgi:hypothetical protein
MKVLLVRLAIVFAIYFAVQGGEYSTVSLFKQRQRERALSQMVDSLQARRGLAETAETPD